MATLSLNTSTTLGASLTALLLAGDIQPGDVPSYQLCKAIYLTHPLGGKMVDAPIEKAQSQKRKITVPDSPEKEVVKAFTDEWARLDADANVAALAGVARIYGVGAIVYLLNGVAPEKLVDKQDLYRYTISFNVLDPLNAAGSLVLNQNPNDMDYQKYRAVTASGTAYDRSRSIVMMNERPIYIAYNSAGFGFNGRSVYQRALFPLKSYVRTMITDDMVARKAGLIVAKIRQAGSIIDAAMALFTGIKRQILREAETDNVISIDIEESIESIDLQNIDKSLITARNNILKNCATAAGMPARMLENETMVEGFGEGTEDAKREVEFINRFRDWLQPVYSYFDEITQYRAWNPEFVATIKAKYPGRYDGMSERAVFFEWKNAFTAEWPSLLIEPESEQAKTEDVKNRSVIATYEVLARDLDPESKADLIIWLGDTISENKRLFPHPLTFDRGILLAYLEDQLQTQQDLANSELAGEQGATGPERDATGHFANKAGGSEEPKPFARAA